MQLSGRFLQDDLDGFISLTLGNVGHRGQRAGVVLVQSEGGQTTTEQPQLTNKSVLRLFASVVVGIHPKSPCNQRLVRKRRDTNERNKRETGGFALRTFLRPRPHRLVTPGTFVLLISHNTENLTMEFTSIVD